MCKKAILLPSGTKVHYSYTRIVRFPPVKSIDRTDVTPINCITTSLGVTPAIPSEMNRYWLFTLLILKKANSPAASVPAFKEAATSESASLSVVPDSEAKVATPVVWLIDARVDVAVVATPPIDRAAV